MAFAQETYNAAGLRLGDSNGLTAGISYQRSFTQYLRAEATGSMQEHDLYDAYTARLMAQYFYPAADQLQLYAGAGGGWGVSNMQAEMARELSIQDEQYLFYAVQAGAMYNFEGGFSLSLDITPEFFAAQSRDRMEVEFILGLKHRF